MIIFFSTVFTGTRTEKIKARQTMFRREIGTVSPIFPILKARGLKMPVKSLSFLLIAIVLSFHAQAANADSVPDDHVFFLESFDDTTFPPEGFSAETIGTGPGWTHQETSQYSECAGGTTGIVAVEGANLEDVDTILISSQLDIPEPLCWETLHLRMDGCQKHIPGSDCVLSFEIKRDDGITEGPWESLNSWPDCSSEEGCYDGWKWLSYHSYMYPLLEQPVRFRIGLRYKGDNCAGIAIDRLLLECYINDPGPSPDDDDDDDDDSNEDDDDGGGLNDDDDDDDGSGCSGCGVSSNGLSIPLFLAMLLIGLLAARLGKATTRVK
jgi:hypothetical protein